MSMITCSECEKPISTKAHACPHCGAVVSPAHAVPLQDAIRFASSTGQIKDITNAPGYVLLGGPVYFAVNGVWSHTAASMILAIVTAGLSWLVYPFFAKRVMREYLVAHGWKAVG